MGGNAATASPNPGYDSNLMRALKLSGNGTSYVVNSPPELRTANVQQLQDQSLTQATLNAMRSAALEKELTPDIAQTRSNLSAAVNEDLANGPNQQLSNMWLKSGLSDAIATGAGTDGSFARSKLADTTRSDYVTERQRELNNAGNLLAANPQPQAGLGVGDLAGFTTQTRNANADARDAYKTSVLQSLGQNSQNWLGALQQSGQMQAANQSNNLSATNASRGANTAFWGTAGGAGAAAAATIGAALIAA